MLEQCSYWHCCNVCLLEDCSRKNGNQLSVRASEAENVFFYGQCLNFVCKVILYTNKQKLYLYLNKKRFSTEGICILTKILLISFFAVN